MTWWAYERRRLAQGARVAGSNRPCRQGIPRSAGGPRAGGDSPGPVSPMTLRTRVAAAAAAAIALAVLLLVIAVPNLWGRELRSSLDDTLRRRAADVAQLNASTPAELTQPGALEGRLTGGSLYVQVLDSSGRLVVRSSALGGRVLPE